MRQSGSPAGRIARSRPRPSAPPCSWPARWRTASTRSRCRRPGRRPAPSGRWSVIEVMRDEARVRRSLVAPTCACRPCSVARLVSMFCRSVVCSAVSVRRRTPGQVGGDGAQRVEQQAVVRALAAAEQRADVDVHRHRRARSDLARDRAVVALVGVVGAGLVRRGLGRRAGEDVAAGVLRVRLLLDLVDQLVDLGRDRVAIASGSAFRWRPGRRARARAERRC